MEQIKQSTATFYSCLPFQNLKWKIFPVAYGVEKSAIVSKTQCNENGGGGYELACWLLGLALARTFFPPQIKHTFSVTCMAFAHTVRKTHLSIYPSIHPSIHPPIYPHLQSFPRIRIKLSPRCVFTSEHYFWTGELLVWLSRNIFGKAA